MNGQTDGWTGRLMDGSLQRLMTGSLKIIFLLDPSISACLEDLFVCLSANRGCHPLLHSRLLPTAVELLSATESQIPLGMVSVRLSDNTLVYF